MALKSLIPVGTERSATRSAPNPFFALQHEIDRLFEGLARNFAGFPSRDVMPSMDLSETDKEIEITAELPGLEEKDIQLNVADNVLTIRGEKKNEREETKKDYHMVERSYGSFTRSVQLPGRRQSRRHQGRHRQGRLEGHGSKAGAVPEQEDRHQDRGLRAGGVCAAREGSAPRRLISLKVRGLGPA